MNTGVHIYFPVNAFDVFQGIPKIHLVIESPGLAGGFFFFLTTELPGKPIKTQEKSQTA